ncbi:MAG: hypothetical protein WDW38_006343 [Sanguina aurantia]
MDTNQSMTPELPSHGKTPELREFFRSHIGPNTTLNYDTSGGAVTVVRGQGCYLFDDEGHKYLDAINNVTHVGHCHPAVTAAVCKQLSTLNTNSRFLHPSQKVYVSRLLATLPEQLEVAYLVTTGSEANDLALRICTGMSTVGATHVAVIGGAYHGHTQALIDLSPYKFWGTGGGGKPNHVHVMPCPDPYRGEHLDGRRAARGAIAAARRAGGRICAFYAESLLSCGGQVIFPPNYLKEVYEEMRAEGAVCIADEVQCGFGRIGASFWGYELYGVEPDIVVLGKAIGNGYPLAAVVVSRQAADAWHNGMEYFNTYGGSTAAIAAGLATLTAVQEEGMMAKSAQTGVYLLSRLKALQPLFPCMGDVRGSGLFAGIEVVTDPVSKTHAPMVAKAMLSEELTPGMWAQLMLKEAAHKIAVMGPRMELYHQNAQQIYGLASKM